MDALYEIASDFSEAFLRVTRAIVDGEKEGASPVSLSVVNAFGGTFLATTLASFSAAFPGLWPVVFQHVHFAPRLMVLISGSLGVAGFAATQCVLTTLEQTPNTYRESLKHSVVRVYIAASLVPMFAHFGVHIGWARYLFWMNNVALLQASHSLLKDVADARLKIMSMTVQSELVSRRGAWQAERSSSWSHCASWCGGDAAPVVVSLAGAHSCATFSIVWAVCHFFAFPTA
uniref:Uncharacterized protein n=1 Tax=Alexandrium monilatum TaxID=311494 RepID=A0A7S4RCK3_9DINO